MLKVEVIDVDCADGEAWVFSVPLDTPWGEINTVIRLLYPTCTSALIETVELD